MKLAVWASTWLVVLGGCGGAASGPPPVVPGTDAPAAAPQSGAPAIILDTIAPVAPDVELRDEKSALVGPAASGIGFDGIDEGLSWPALAKAAPKKATIAITVARDVPVKSVLRAVWTLRDADVRVQTKDAAGVLHVIDLAPKPAHAAAGCHLAAFVSADGALRVAAPGGPRLVKNADDLARALEAERAACAIRYVAFGAEDPRAAWGTVFDVAWAVTRGGSAGDARVVLAEPIHDTGK